MEESYPDGQRPVNSNDQPRHPVNDLDPLAPLAAYEHGWLCYHPAVARALGSVEAAILLHKMLKWSEIETAKHRNGWFYAARDQITHETGMTRDNQETARKILVRFRVLEEERRGNPYRLWYRVSRQAIHDLLTAHAAKELSAKPETRPSFGGKAPNKRGDSPPTNRGDVRRPDGRLAPDRTAGLPPASDSASRSTPSFELPSTPLSLRPPQGWTEGKRILCR